MERQDAEEEVVSIICFPPYLKFLVVVEAFDAVRGDDTVSVEFKDVLCEFRNNRGHGSFLDSMTTRRW